MPSWSKLGIIAGGGELPVVLAEHCAATNRPYFVARVTPYADAALDAHPGSSNSLGHMGARMDAMRAAGCDAVVLIGQVPRQDPRNLNLDAGGMAMAPALLAAAPQGDDALLRALLSEHERAGFRVVGADEAMVDLLAQPGAWGAVAPSPQQQKDIARAAKIAAAIGSYDVGQGVVVCDGIVLAVEAQEGTDAMLGRVSELPLTVRGAPEARRGVLVKRPKPIQERRIDLPTMGVRTIEGAAKAGLAGIAVEAGGALVVRRDEVIAAADRAGIFVVGFTPADVGEA
ncbi:LpxI family protein [Vitreimonas flagellata]|uniref:LpxI family protein n=1 Tax=Vitreimonas flagellata TaxID=2560861 RepID=UPI001074C13B|nr:UDP-2,3-diacylglucosamine diphosphatase LpxI [Vitreimonas flagellata]